MTLFQSLILGIVQGLTEFIPVSSSAHLVLVPALLGWEIDPELRFAFDVLVQTGTLVAVIVYFWGDLVAMAQAMLAGLAQRRPFATPPARLGWLVGLATVPAVALGLLLKDAVEAAFASPVATALFLLLTAGMMTVSERFSRQARALDQMNATDALLIGLAQVLATFPGVSRSGATVSAGLGLGLLRPAAARFSFLMSIPAMLGAAVLAVADLLEAPHFASYLPVLAVGFTAAAVVGYLSIRWLLAYLARRPLYVFAVYCVLAAGLTLLVLALRPGA